VRTVDRDGKLVEPGWSECSRGGGYAVKESMWAVVDTSAMTDWVTVYGRVPASAVSVRITWRDGGVEGPVKVDGNRYFLAFLPYNTQDAENWATYEAEALDAEGRVVATERNNR